MMCNADLVPAQVGPDAAQLTAVPPETLPTDPSETLSAAQPPLFDSQPPCAGPEMPPMAAQTGPATDTPSPAGLPSAAPSAFVHRPVLLEACLQGLAIRPWGVYLDGTAGGAGHAVAIARQLDGGRLIALDQDPDAVATATQRLAGLPATVVQENFRHADVVLDKLGIPALQGCLLDLGVSSHQLDTASRGFSYHADAPLDMRMSQSGPTAADLVNTAGREELARILREYGEEPYAWAIAGRIVHARALQPIVTTGQLAELVASALPPAQRRKQKNPSRRTFQAIRIAVNGELDALSEGLDVLFERLAPGGRFCVITFHSLEDRLVKQRFRDWCTACTCPPGLPVCVCGGRARAVAITRHPQVADAAEQAENRRSRSAKLRIIEKL